MAKDFSYGWRRAREAYRLTIHMYNGVAVYCLYSHRQEERELIVTSGSEFRQFVFELVESKWFSFGILTVIILNTVFIAVQTSEYVLAKSGK